MESLELSAGQPVTLGSVGARPTSSAAGAPGASVYGNALQAVPQGPIAAAVSGGGSGSGLGTPALPVAIRITKDGPGGSGKYGSSFKTYFNIAIFALVLWILFSPKFTGKSKQGSGGMSPLDAIFGAPTSELHERPNVSFDDVKVCACVWWTRMFCSLKARCQTMRPMANACVRVS